MVLYFGLVGWIFCPLKKPVEGSLSHFLDQSPTVTREVAVHVLTESRLALLAA
jgi:hypothetical protein